MLPEGTDPSAGPLSGIPLNILWEDFQETLRKVSGNSQGTLRERSGNSLEIPRRLSGDTFPSKSSGWELFLVKAWRGNPPRAFPLFVIDSMFVKLRVKNISSFLVRARGGNPPRAAPLFFD